LSVREDLQSWTGLEEKANLRRTEANHRRNKGKKVK
jgi:hypothetical protein